MQKQKRYYWIIERNTLTILDKINGFKKPSKYIIIAETKEEAIKKFDEDWGKDDLKTITKGEEVLN